MTTPPATLLPTELLYGTVRWTVVGIDPDSALDPDAFPNADQVTGRATFTAMPSVIVKSPAPPVTVLPQPQTYQIVNGKLVDNENRTDVRLLANNSPGTTPQGWSYHVDWELDDGYTFGSFDFYLAADEVKELTLSQPLDSPAPGVIITKGDKGDTGRGFNPRGLWATGRTYAVDDIVTAGGSTFRVTAPVALSSGAAPTPTTPGASYELWAQKGDQGIQGVAATVAVGTVTTGAAGSAAAVTNAGTTAAAVFNFTIPRGATGRGFVPRGVWTAGTAYAVDDLVQSDGSTFRVVTAHTAAAPAPTVATPGANFELWARRGDTGAAATVAVGTVTTGAPGSAVVVTNRGTSAAAILDFTIPQGAVGAGAPPATATALGSVQLAGDLGGTATAPTVPTKVNKNGDTLTGALSLASFAGGLNVHAGTLLNSAVVPNAQDPVQDPFPDLWHDILSFNRHLGLPVQERSVDGLTAWTAMTLNTELFARRENQNSLIVDGVNYDGVRWTWTNGNLLYSQVKWMVLGFNYVAENTPKEVRVESSQDAGVTWTTRHLSTGGWSGTAVWCSIQDWGGAGMVRVTVRATGVGPIRMSTMRFLSNRWGDQGGGSELERPFYWDNDRGVTFLRAYSENPPVGAGELTRRDWVEARTPADPAAGTAGLRTLGTGATQALPGNHASTTNARTPTAHAASHATGAADPVTPAAIGAAAATHTHTAAQLSDASAVGRSVLTAADAAGARGAIGAGTGNVVGTGITAMVSITQAAYTALTTKDPATLYVIVG